MNTQPSYGVLLHFQQIDSDTWAIRFIGGGDRKLYEEIRDTMKTHDKTLWRWDETLNNGHGAWRVNTLVLYNLRCYFPLVQRHFDTVALLERLFSA